MKVVNDLTILQNFYEVTLTDSGEYEYHDVTLKTHQTSLNAL